MQVKPNDTVLTNLLDLDRKGMEREFVRMGEKPFRASQLLKWIHQRGMTDFDAMTNLSKTLRHRLNQSTEVRPPEVVFERKSKDGTRKWLLRLTCGNKVETVFIPESGRGTLCVSSQIGCALDCSFCSTGRQGFNRNLAVSEIIGQVWLAQQMLDEGEKMTNIVMMGMGEPLLNFTNVVAAMDLMMDDYGYGLSKRRVTLSTAGVVPALDRLGAVSNVGLAISLHATDDALRDQLVPLNRKYPIRELLDACKRYISRIHRGTVTFEYVMLDGVNDSPAQARSLCKLLKNIPSKVNLIPFNPFPGTPYRCSPSAVIRRFAQIVQDTGFVTTTRKTRGDDIDAACGQLVGRVTDRTHRAERRLAVVR